MVIDNKAETGSTVFNELKTDAFRPLGRASSRSRANQSNDREKATTKAHEDPIMKTEKGYSSKICMKKSYKNTHSEVVESKNKNMPTCEPDHKNNIERANHWSNEAGDISRRMNLNRSRTSELLPHETLRKKSTSREVDTIHHEVRKEVSGASSSTISETTRHVKEEADNDFFKERRKVVDLDGSIISDLAIHEDPWEETYPCEKRKKIINKDISIASGLVNREDLWENTCE